MEFSVGDLVQTRHTSRRGVGERAFTLPAAWLGIVLGVHATGALRVMFNESSRGPFPRVLWASPELLMRMQ